jgi:hypothetical protein
VLHTKIHKLTRIKGLNHEEKACFIEKLSSSLELYLVRENLSNFQDISDYEMSLSRHVFYRKSFFRP